MNIIISNKIDFKTRSIARDKEEHDKSQIHQEDTIISNLHVPNNIATKHKRKKW